MRLALLVVLIMLCVGHGWAEEADTAASALVSLQNADGSFGSEDLGSQSQVYTTARVLAGLLYYGEESGTALKGIEWIKLQSPKDTAALSEAIKVLHLSGRPVEPELLGLVEYQNTDGGWGKTDGFESTTWYTSSAIIALGPFEDYLDSRLAGGEYLLKEQGADGGFEDSALITSNCVYALVMLYDTTKRDEFALAALGGYQWLNNTIDDEGVWDSTTSTGNAIIALGALYLLTGDEDVKALGDRAKEWMASSQQDEEDALAISWNLAALTYTVQVAPAQSKTTLSASLTQDYVFGSDVTRIKFKIENRGLSNMKNVSLLLSVPKELNAGINKTSFFIDSLLSGRSMEFEEVIQIPDGAVAGEYPIIISGDAISASVTLHVMESPLIFEISPTELKSDEPTDFKIQITNIGDMGFFIKNITPVVDGGWRGVELNSVQVELEAGSSKSAALFSAMAPEERGEYNVPVEIEFESPELGERKISSSQKFLVGGGVPSGVLKLMLYGTLVLSVMMLLNLLLGYDLVG
ncbi:hypothetical protein KKA03_05690 [archaeon]|nr:hypothetical protein [archaeon]